VEVRSLDHALHSGMYGGPVPDALTGLVKLLAALTDADGAVAIPGFADDARPLSADERRRLDTLDFDETRFREEAGLLDGVELVGDRSCGVLERLWARPTATVVGLDATPVASASNTLTPAARAKVSLRLAPGQDPDRALRRLSSWLSSSAPWGLRTTVIPGAKGRPFVADPSAPAFSAAERALGAAYGAPVVYQGVGGSIPLLEPLTTRLGPAGGAPIPALLTGVEDPDGRAHGIDESLHLADWERACLAEALLFAELAAS